VGSPVRRIPLPAAPDDPHLRQEWLVTNGLGGYASGTVAGLRTRRFHGMLVAALPAPLGRIMMLQDVSEQVRLPDRRFFVLGGAEYERPWRPVDGRAVVKEFRLEMGLPVWIYEVEGFVIERRLLMPHRQNTVHVGYRLLGGRGTLRLGLRPAVHFRPHDAPVSIAPGAPYSIGIRGDEYQIAAPGDLPALRLLMYGERPAFTSDPGMRQFIYLIEQSRGYDYVGDLWSPGYFRADLAANRGATLVASTESWETIRTLPPEEAARLERNRRTFLLAAANPAARDGLGPELVLAADQFIINPAGRVGDAVRARAAGDHVRTVIAGYHWFTDWGRDTMISLEGLTLDAGRRMEAGWILRTFARYVRDGLIPNMFPEGEREALYHTADATLWFFHAINRYVEATGDRVTLRLLLPALVDIIEWHLRGTRFGIGVDPEDGLLRQGQSGYQLTWMDAKVEDWVVTPRRGKAVEINALWHNALCLLAQWLAEEGGEDCRFAEYAARARESFNRRFWYGQGGYLYDVVDGEQGDDPSCRPNQVFAISLDNPVLEERRWAPVMDVVRERLLTPVGLRTLAPGHPDYKDRYYGDLRARDAAYHQGTVWPWLIGPFIDAWMRTHPEERAGARRFLAGFEDQLSKTCIGSINEIHDAEPPFTPRGCIAQAWSVAEVLRAWVKTAG
jgi:predicted glycogen debranching enzyme